MLELFVLEINIMDDKRITITQSVRYCARCSQNHYNVEFYLFQNPVHITDVITLPFWAMCPTTGEPLFLKIIKES